MYMGGQAKMDKLNIPDVSYEITELDRNRVRFRTRILKVRATIAYAMIVTEDAEGKLSAVIKDRDLTTEDERDDSQHIIYNAALCLPYDYDSFDEFRESYMRGRTPDHVDDAIWNAKVELIEDVPKRRTVCSLESLCCEGEFYTVVWEGREVQIERHKLNRDMFVMSHSGDLILNGNITPIEFHKVHVYDSVAGVLAFKWRGKSGVDGLILDPRTPTEVIRQLTRSIRDYAEMGFIHPLKELILLNT